MSIWVVVDRIIGVFPPIAATVLAVVIIVMFIIGFARRGMNFIKYGFGKIGMDETLEKRFDSLEAKFDDRFSRIDARFSQIDERFSQIDEHFAQIDDRFSQIDARFSQIDARFSQIDDRFSQIDTRIGAIETNHFGHLKNFLTELIGILLDRDVINNADKARLDNQLRGM